MRLIYYCVLFCLMCNVMETYVNYKICFTTIGISDKHTTLMNCMH